MKVLLLFSLLAASLSAETIYPTSGTVWKVGQTVQVKFNSGQPGETVNIFFSSDRTASLGGGPIDSHGSTFYITVPAKALSPAGKTSDLLAVHRINRRLSSVDSVSIKVVS